MKKWEHVEKLELGFEQVGSCRMYYINGETNECSFSWYRAVKLQIRGLYDI